MSFQISQPGMYRQRNGAKAEVVAIARGKALGFDSDGEAINWSTSGRWICSDEEESWDIIAPWVDAPDPGDGWRLLEEWEVIERGDELKTKYNDWITSQASVGSTVGYVQEYLGKHKPSFRRRVPEPVPEPPPPPPETWVPTCELRWKRPESGWGALSPAHALSLNTLVQRWTCGVRSEWRPVPVEVTK